jgi:hypothetical protein
MASLFDVDLVLHRKGRRGVQEVLTYVFRVFAVGIDHEISANLKLVRDRSFLGKGCQPSNRGLAPHVPCCEVKWRYPSNECHSKMRLVKFAEGLLQQHYPNKLRSLASKKS